MDVEIGTDLYGLGASGRLTAVIRWFLSDLRCRIAVGT
jgi:hypothetical protein